MKVDTNARRVLTFEVVRFDHEQTHFLARLQRCWRYRCVGTQGLTLVLPANNSPSTGYRSEGYLALGLVFGTRFDLFFQFWRDPHGMVSGVFVVDAVAAAEGESPGYTAWPQGNCSAVDTAGLLKAPARERLVGFVIAGGVSRFLLVGALLVLVECGHVFWMLRYSLFLEGLEDLHPWNWREGFRK